MSKSALKDLETLESRVRSRMDELKPQLEEFEELKVVADKLGIEVPTLNGAMGTAGKAKVAKRSRGGRGKTAPRGSARSKRRPRTNYMPLLETAIKAEPGLPASKLAEKVGDDRKSSTYRIIRRWKDEGTIEERDGGVVWTA